MRLNTTHQWWTKSRHWTHMFPVNLFPACILQVEWFHLEVNSPHFKFAWMSKGHLSTWTCISKMKTKAMVCPVIHCFLLVLQNSWLLWQKHGCSAAPCSSGEQKPWKLWAAGVVSKLTNVALNKSVKMSVCYTLGTIRDWQAVGKPTWLISDINSNFLKTTLLNRWGKNQTQIW